MVRISALRRRRNPQTAAGSLIAFLSKDSRISASNFWLVRTPISAVSRTFSISSSRAGSSSFLPAKSWPRRLTQPERVRSSPGTSAATSRFLAGTGRSGPRGLSTGRALGSSWRGGATRVSGISEGETAAGSLGGTSWRGTGLATGETASAAAAGEAENAAGWLVERGSADRSVARGSSEAVDSSSAAPPSTSSGRRAGRLTRATGRAVADSSICRRLADLARRMA
jgi:hypothetical protein